MGENLDPPDSYPSGYSGALKHEDHERCFNCGYAGLPDSESKYDENGDLYCPDCENELEECSWCDTLVNVSNKDAKEIGGEKICRRCYERERKSEGRDSKDNGQESIERELVSQRNVHRQRGENK